MKIDPSKHIGFRPPLPPKPLVRLIFLVLLFLWAAMTLFEVIVLFSDINQLRPGIPVWLPRVLLILYALTLYYYHSLRSGNRAHLGFTGFLWHVFFTGLPIAIASLLVQLLLFSLANTNLSRNVVFLDIIYHTQLALFLSFLIAALTAWKPLIFYQKSKPIIYAWRFFHLALACLLVVDGFEIQMDILSERALLAMLGVAGLFLSINVKWIAYLSVRQKWTSLLLLVLIFLYLYYFRYTVTTLSDAIQAYSLSFIDFKTHAFSLSLFGFVLLYSVFSFLVILFNLPTSSVFEQKLGETLNLRRISQSVQTERNEDSIYRILLTGAADSSSADAAWVEIETEEGKNQIFTHGVDMSMVRLVRSTPEIQKSIARIRRQSKRAKHVFEYVSDIRRGRFRSALALPIVVQDKMIGILILLRQLSNGFNEEIANVVETFSNQARISIENFRLLDETIQNERYKEELKIAKRVHKKLLPEKLETGEDFSVAAFSRSADGVGGDYYDMVRIDSCRVALIIADVSGKGATAAFQMAQMKGVFQSLARQGLSPDAFMLQANETLTACLERGSFISAIYFIINMCDKKISYARAGHCPALYCRADDSPEYLQDKGVALGALTNQSYAGLIDMREIHYQPGDVIALYTDGVTEAKNANGEEYGYDRLVKSLQIARHGDAGEIQERLIANLYAYAGTKDIQDDYTMVVVRFKKLTTPDRR